MITVREAQDRIRAAIPAPVTEQVGFRSATGRVLAHDILATMPQPRFTTTAMDGFALRAADTRQAIPDQPVGLEVAGGVLAGDPGQLTIGPGQCAQIMTGAPLPAGTDAVVMVEQTAGFGADTIQITAPVPQGQYVRREGEEVRQGQLLIPAGTRVGPGELGILATYGYAQVEVVAQPRVALVATGDELRDPGTQLEQGQIYNSNLYVLAHLAALAGGEPAQVRTIGDDPPVLKAFLAEALESSQVVVSSAGVSMGRSDYVRQALLELGVEEVFWKVAQKPGMPLLFGRRGPVLIFGLPGNPVSAFICFMEYVWPALEALLRLASAPQSAAASAPPTAAAPAPKLSAILASPFPSEPAKHRFLFGQAWLEEGRLLAAPSEKLGSHMLSSALGANAILEAPPGPASLPPGAQVRLRLLPWAQPIAGRPLRPPPLAGLRQAQGKA